LHKQANDNKTGDLMMELVSLQVPFQQLLEVIDRLAILTFLGRSREAAGG
jgi:type VI protein secretion system component VasF